MLPLAYGGLPQPWQKPLANHPANALNSPVFGKRGAADTDGLTGKAVNEMLAAYTNEEAIQAVFEGQGLVQACLNAVNGQPPSLSLMKEPYIAAIVNALVLSGTKGNNAVQNRLTRVLKTTADVLAGCYNAAETSFDEATSPAYGWGIQQSVTPDAASECEQSRAAQATQTVQGFITVLASLYQQQTSEVLPEPLRQLLRNGLATRYDVQIAPIDW